MIKKRNTKNREIKYRDGSFRINYGTHNRHEPSVIFVNGRTWLEPIHDDIPSIINKINSLNRREVNKLLTNNNVFFKNKLLFDVDIATNHMLKNKKSLLTFDLYLLQKNMLDFDDINVEKEINVLSDKIIKLIDKKLSNDVILSKEK